MTKPATNIWYKYVTVWSNGLRTRVYPAISLGYAMREAQGIIQAEGFSFYHEIMVCPLDLLEDSGECHNFLRREDIFKWYRETRPWVKDNFGATYTPPKDLYREHRGLSPHPYPPFTPGPTSEDPHRLPLIIDTSVVQKILEDDEKKQRDLNKFLDYGIETWNIKVSREDEMEEKVMEP